MTLILHVRKRAQKSSALPSRTAGRWWPWDSSPGGLVARPVLLSTSRLCGLRHALFSQSFSPNTGTGHKAWTQTSTELAQLSKTELCTGRTSLYPWLDLRIFL